VENYGRGRQAAGDSIIWRMRIACWITKVTNTHSKYVKVVAFPQQQWLRERASIWHLCVHRLCFRRYVRKIAVMKNAVSRL